MRKTACVIVIVAAGAMPTVATSAGSPDFAAKGNAACQTFYDQTAKTPQPKTTAAAVVYLKKTTALATSLKSQLTSLTPPASDRSSFQSMLGVMGKELALLKQTLSQQGDPTAVNRSLAKLDALDKQFNALANKIGLKVCGETNPKSSKTA